MKRETFIVLLFLFLLAACSKEEKTALPLPPVVSSFAKGADVSWLTEMESSGRLFFTADGGAAECLSLLKGLGMNAIRLRVWVNPADGWCSITDVVTKARRAHQLGLQLLIDFHYSDSWADPGKQTKPKAWQPLSFAELKEAVATHTREVLLALQAEKITPRWVQVGNETGNGMLWPDGRADTDMQRYAKLNNAGYDAVKAVFPDAKVVIHLQNGNDNNLFRWLFDGLQAHGARWDVIGLSLYPSPDNWQTMNAACLYNMNDMIARYQKEVMICEVGMSWDAPDASYSFLHDLLQKAQAIAGHKCLGLFYWEPQSYNWQQYSKGAFTLSGRPTHALDAFR
ncbi:MAG: glycosyl hydrolase 53 family protein [Bacteroidaceae bacterium]|nr:glycosyl hydrolase 53 family protein [Bacteroidaceae bacterium]